MAITAPPAVLLIMLAFAVLLVAFAVWRHVATR
jgi:hypothetical protein